LVRWQTDRLPSLAELDTQCSVTLAKAPPNPRLAEENMRGYPTAENIARDFDRFGFNLKVELAADPANALRLQRLAALNKWRNVAAHHTTTLPPGIPLTLAAVQSWRLACDDLTSALDANLINQLRRLFRRKPW
jgi:hypothetical protein